LRRVIHRFRFLPLVMGALLAAASPMAAQAAKAPGLGSADNFAVLSAAPGGGGAVTCTNGTITGDVGSSGVRASVVQTSCPITGSIIAPVSAQVVKDFNTAYAAFAAMGPCNRTFGIADTLAGLSLAPGVYCFTAAATLTGTLTLTGSGPWLFKIGTLGTGALTGTNFTVVTSNPCNVNWWVAQAATMTTSSFAGTILAGAAITLTGGTFNGNALAKAAVTITGTAVTGCAAGKDTGEGKEKAHCNQGVGNGPEGCDPGNSNNHNTSNDELGGTPGHPGRQGHKSSESAIVASSVASAVTSSATSSGMSNAPSNAISNAGANATSKAGVVRGQSSGSK
jgi:Ice-binding-like